MRRVAYAASAAQPRARFPFRSDINGLRALSVGLVVLFHARLRGAGGGFIGVDIFFVISGFLMTRIIVSGLESNAFSYLEFLRARAARIWPALGAMVIGLLLLGAVLLPPSDLLQMAQQSVWPLIFWSNEYFRHHAGYATQEADGHWFLQTWSLSLEWQFYVLYPLILMVALRWSMRPGVRSLIRSTTLRTGLPVLFLMSLALYLNKCSTDPNGAFFLLPARSWELLAGGLVILGGDLQAAAGARLRALASYGGIALIVLSAIWLGHDHVDAVGVGWRSVPPVLGAALVLWSDDRDNLLLGNRIAQAVGRWSYSIYLWHWPLVVLCAMDAVADTRPLTGVAIIGLGSLLLGSLSYRWVESAPKGLRPARARLSELKPFLLMGLAAVAAAIGYATDGLRFRMPGLAAGSLVKPALESDYFPDNCSNFEKPVEQVRPCTIEKGGRRVLVIGDSLAENLWPWFKVHSAVSVDFLTESECPPIPHFDRLQAGFHCMDYAQLAWRTAAQSRYDTVIVSGNWDLVGAIGPNYCHEDAAGTCRIVKGADKTRLVLEELHTAIASTLAAGKNVVVLQNSPEAHVVVPTRLERERYWFGEPRLSISAKAVAERFAWIDTMFATFQGTPGFYLLSFRPILCKGDSCVTYDKELKRPVYLDNRHFDPTWIEARGGIFQPFVEPAPPPVNGRDTKDR